MSDTEKEETLEENSQEFETPVNSSDNPDTDKVKAAEIAELDIERISQVIDKQAETASPRENFRYFEDQNSIFIYPKMLVNLQQSGRKSAYCMFLKSILHKRMLIEWTQI